MARSTAAKKKPAAKKKSAAKKQPAAKKKPAAKKQPAAKKKSAAKKQPAAKKPAAKKKSAAKKPAAKKPAAKKSAAKQPAAKKPAAKQPAAKKKSAAKQPAASIEQPAIEQPAVEQPAVEQPAVEQPAVEQPAISRDNTLPAIFAGIAEAGIEYSEFELCDPNESDDNLRAWLGGLPADGSRVVTFAQDGMGSYFGVWLRAEHPDPETAPIVFLGSEGETAVLAKHPRAFIEQLGAGKVFDGYRGSFFASDDEDEERLERSARAASFAKQALGLDALREPEAIKAEAEAAWGDFQAWVDANNAHR